MDGERSIKRQRSSATSLLVHCVPLAVQAADRLLVVLRGRGDESCLGRNRRFLGHV
jgi:hypothetical protein